MKLTRNASEPLKRHGERCMFRRLAMTHASRSKWAQLAATREFVQEAAQEKTTTQVQLTMADKDAGKEPEQLLHLVFGGELSDLDGVDFNDLSKLDIVGMFPDYASAYDAWKNAAQRTVDNAQMRYFVVHIHRLLEPDLNEKS